MGIDRGYGLRPISLCLTYYSYVFDFIPHFIGASIGSVLRETSELKMRFLWDISVTGETVELFMIPNFLYVYVLYVYDIELLLFSLFWIMNI